MRRGSLVLVPFPFTDLSSQKLRPAVVVDDLPANFYDKILVFVSSKIGKVDKKYEFVVDENVAGFSDTGLKVSSKIICNKVATLDRRIILGEIGIMSDKQMVEVDKRLNRALGLG